MKNFICLTVFVFAACQAAVAQVPVQTAVQIVKAEDARRFDKVIENLLRSPIAAVRERAALAAGRIGDDRAVEPLAALLDDKRNAGRVWTMAVFAIGEIESVKGADNVITVIKSESGYIHRDPALLSRAFEAAGKIAAANPKDPKAKELGETLLTGLELERTSATPLAEVIRRGVTAVMRMRPIDGDKAIIPFLASANADVVADTLNALVRLRSKNATREASDLLRTSADPIVRANAARVLGATDAKDSADDLIKAAISDKDGRVRIAAIRSLSTLKVAKAAEPLLTRGENLLKAYKDALKPHFIPVEQNEFIEISSALGQILAKSANPRAIAMFRDFAAVDDFKTVEPYLARVKVGGIRPGAGLGNNSTPSTYRQYSTLARTVGELASYEPETAEARKIKDEAPAQLRKLANALLAADPKTEPFAVTAAPDALQAFARFKTDDLGDVLRGALKNADIQIRAAAAGLIAGLPPSDENIDALNEAFDFAWKNDLESNDAILSSMDSMFQLDKAGKRGSVAAFILAAASPDQLVRLRALSILKNDAYKNKPEIQTWLASDEAKNAGVVRRWAGKGSKIGQILSSDADYRRALSRKNGTIRAVLTTEKGVFSIEFSPEAAPLTVENFVKLARAGYFNGHEVHRVVPNFVVQDGDPLGNGNGGPGWTIRCEVNMLPFDRGAVGMALSGKDTGGSQWFVTHSPQPHLDGGYTVFGHVDEAGMKVVDRIVRGDKILKVSIVEGRSKR
jgi:cyclophilin family peptidyl-prolyl cis-trans isomerase